MPSTFQPVKKVTSVLTVKLISIDVVPAVAVDILIDQLKSESFKKEFKDVMHKHYPELDSVELEDVEYVIEEVKNE